MSENFMETKDYSTIPGTLDKARVWESVGRDTKTEGELLLQAVAEGSSAAFAELYQQYLPMVYHYVAKFLNFHQVDIEEVAQDVLLKVWKKRSELPLIQSFEKYLYVMSRNTLTDFCRKRNRQLEKQASIHANSQALALPDYPADETLLSKEYMDHAKLALSELPEKRRIIFELRTQKELSLEEIASYIGMSVAGVHQNIKKATIFISDYLKKNGLHISIFLITFWINMPGK